MKKQVLLFFALFLGCFMPALAQGVRYDIPPILTSTGKPVSSPVISLCPGTATVSGAACSPATGQSTTDITTNTLCPIGSPVTLTGLNTCQATGDNLGNAGFWLKPGAYIFCITGSGITGACYNLTVPLGATSAGIAIAPNIGNVLYVGPGGYATVAAAVTAAGSNRMEVYIMPTATDLTCPPITTNLLFHDLRGTAGGCANNTLGINDNTTIVNAMVKEQMSVTTIPNTGSALSHWFISILSNGTPPSASTILDGTSPECLVTGALTGTLGLCDASEGAAGVFSTGGTVNLVEGGQGYFSDIAGRTTAVLEARGLDGIGCNGVTGTPKPVKCVGLYARQQGTQASSQNYALVAEANTLTKYDGVTLSKWKWDVEDNTHTVFPFIFLDGADNQIHVQAVNANGLQVADSAAGAHLKITSTGISLGNSVVSPTAALDLYGDMKLEANNRFAPFEGTCSAGIASFDMVCANAADHALTLSNNAGAYGHVLATGSLDAKGIQTKRVAGCATAASLNATCDTTVTWTTPFASANYTVTCTGDVVTSGVPIVEGTNINTAKVAASSTVRTISITAAAAQFTTIDCTAVSD